MHTLSSDALTRVAASVSESYEEFFGRAPESAVAGLHADSLVVTARGILTETERTYPNRADQLRLRECRTLFQFADPQHFCRPIEEITGRRVTSLVSGIDVHADIATETFVLEPLPAGIHDPETMRRRSPPART